MIHLKCRINQFFGGSSQLLTYFVAGQTMFSSYRPAGTVPYIVALVFYTNVTRGGEEMTYTVFQRIDIASDAG